MALDDAELMEVAKSDLDKIEEKKNAMDVSLAELEEKYSKLAQQLASAESRIATIINRELKEEK